MIIQYSRWIKSFYILGLNVGFVLLLAVIGYFHFQSWKENRRYGYHTAARSMLKGADADGITYIATGFEALQDAFSDPAQIHLQGYLTNHRDTVIRSQKDTIHSVYYAYHFGTDTAVFFSRVDVCREHPQIIAFNQKPASDTFYQELDRNFDRYYKKRMDSILSALEESLKK